MLEVNQTQIKDIFRIKPRTLEDWVSQGFPHRRDGQRNYYIVRDCVSWYVRRRLAEERGDSNVVSLDEARARQQTASAVKTEMEIEVRRGNLVEIDRLEQPWNDVAQVIVGFCDTFTGRLKMRHPNLDESMLTSIRDELARMRNDLHQSLTEWSP